MIVSRALRRHGSSSLENLIRTKHGRRLRLSLSALNTSSIRDGHQQQLRFDRLNVPEESSQSGEGVRLDLHVVTQKKRISARTSVDTFPGMKESCSLQTAPLSIAELEEESPSMRTSVSGVSLSTSDREALAEATQYLLNELCQWNDVSRQTNISLQHSPRRSRPLGPTTRSQRYYHDHRLPPSRSSPWWQQVASLSTTQDSTASSSPSTSNPVPPVPQFSSGSPTPNPTPRLNVPLPTRRLTPTRVPTPPSGPAEPADPIETLKKTDPQSVVRKGLDMTASALKTVLKFLFRLPFNIFYYITHPKETSEKYAEIKQVIKDEIHHYWVGTKLLWADIQTARSLIGKTLQGSSLTRRERKQLLRTVSDLFRMVPFSMFLIIPLGELALPFVLRIFPNMLPSTFQDSLKNEENMKRELQGRIAMTQFFQETLEELAKEQKRKAHKKNKELQEAGEDGGMEEEEDSARSMLEFLESARSGKMIPPEVIIKYATYFQDDLTLDNMPRMQLVNMCKYMGTPPYGSDAFLRFQLRHKIRMLKEDDQRILWEGIDSLTKMELREACRERGMRSTGLSKDAYKRALLQWLELSVEKNVPIALLIMSRTFFLQEEVFERKSAENESEDSLAGLADAISGMDKEVLNEVILEVATSEEKSSNPEVRKIKLEVVSQQNELIREEQQAREEAKKQKEKAETSEVEGAAADSMPDASTPTESSTVSSTEKETLTSTGDVETETDKRSEEQEPSLTSAEMDAISQLLSDDPVSMERAELQKIKEAMKKQDDVAASEGTTESKAEDDEDKEQDDSLIDPSPMSAEEADQMVASMVDKSQEQAEMESGSSTQISMEGKEIVEEAEPHDEEDEPDDPVVSRLKRRIETMVDKIEVQLTETELKIGDKLHFLDKDRDGILSQEEIAEVMQQVLKRNISFEEAIELAQDMDANCDGVFTVEELIRWIDEHKLVQFVEEGRDADMDRILLSLKTGEKQPREDASSTSQS